MTPGGRRRSVAFIIAFGVCLTAGAIALNVGWIVINWREAGLLIAGVLLFPIIITGVVLNTIFLVREIRRNEQHDAFINAVTHELKTPLASIRLYLQTLQARDLDPAKRQEFYGVMVADTDRLIDTIEQVLRAGRMGARGRQTSWSRIDLGELVRECIALARTRYRLPDEALSYAESASADERNVIGDVEELKAAFSNLVDNAIKYSGPQVRVDVELGRADDRQIRVRVRDYGVGISPPELKRIFKRFYRVPGATASRVKGTGLGLFIVRSVAKRHGGRVFAESEGPGHGAAFTLQLPIAPPS